MRFIQTLRRYPWIRNCKLVEERTSARQVVELFSNPMTNFGSFEMSRIAVPLMTFQIRLAPPPPLKSLTLHYSREGASMLGLFIGGFFDIPSKRIHLTVDWMFDRAEEFLQILQLIFEMNATIELTFGLSDEAIINQETFTWPQRLFRILRGFSAITYHPWLFHYFFSTGTFEHLESICLNDQSDVDGLLRMIAEKCPKLTDLIVCTKSRRRSITPAGILAFLHKWQLRVVNKLSIMWFTMCTMQKVFEHLSADETVR
ncbi:Bifunctional protein FolD [Trichinella spiralis]|uniref:Bifunctional protein FolD n=1 Tax=Trichinella spiralis TaxID=6334 RepID=A0ABR3KN19_TRISP